MIDGRAKRTAGLLSNLVVFAILSGTRVVAADWYYPQWQYRTPFYVSSATADDIDGQPVFLQGLINTVELGDKARSNLGDLRFTWYDAETGIETPIDHFIPNATQHAQTTVNLSGPIRIRRGTGVFDTLWKYSTHHRVNPANYFHDGRLYMSYVARPGSQNVVDLLVYDTNTKTFEGPVRIANLLPDANEEENEHRAPAILVDKDGYIHIVYGAHGTVKVLSYRRSINPGDISAFTPQVTLNPQNNTYPSILQLNDGSIYVFVRVNRSSDWWISYYRSINGGQTWSGENPVIRGNGQVSYPSSIVSGPDGNSIHITWHWQDSSQSGGNQHRGVMYTWSGNGGQTWRKADGTAYTSVIARTSSDIDYIATGGNMRPHDVDVDSNGRPHIVWGGVDAPDSLYHSTWNGNNWVTTTISTASFHWSTIRIYPDDEVRIHATQQLGGYNITSFRSFDLGGTWELAYSRYRGLFRSTVPQMPRPAALSPIASTWGGNNSQGGYGPMFLYPQDHAHAQATIYMYHGNPEATRSDVPNAAHLKDIFDNFFQLTDTLPPGWDVTTQGNGSVTVVPGTGVTVSNPDSTPGGRAAIVRPLDNVLGHGYYRTRVRFGSNAQNHYVATFRNEDGETMHLLNAAADGTWKYQQEGGGFTTFPNPTSYAPNNFYNIEIWWDTEAGIFRVTANNISLTGDRGVPLPTSSTSRIDRITQRTGIGEPASFTTREVEVYGTPFRLDYSLDADFVEERSDIPEGASSLFWSY